MSSTNKRAPAAPVFTHEGGVAKRINAEQQLRRSVLSTFLWEDSFYEDGESIADRIRNAVKLVRPEVAAKVAIEARSKYKLRHVPLLIVREMARIDTHKGLVSSTLANIIQRPDEMGEFLSIYWKDGKEKLSAQVKKGLAKAFVKFNEFQLAKYDRDSAEVKLRDVLFLCHAKPKGDPKKFTKIERLQVYKNERLLKKFRPEGFSDQEKLLKRVVARELATPDTWETELSAGKDKKGVFERLLKEDKLGPLALIRNLRNMTNAGVSEKLVKDALGTMKTDRVLPYRFLAAAKYAPGFEPQLETAMFSCLKSHEKLLGKTILLLDVSGSMDNPLSAKSDMNRIDAAAGLAILLREISDDVKVYTFSNDAKLVPARRGFALKDAIWASQPHGGTALGQSLNTVFNKEKEYDRIIVITDEQSSDSIPRLKGKGYMVNVANYQHGVGYGSEWVHIDGFSEAIVDWVREIEGVKD